MQTSAVGLIFSFALYLMSPILAPYLSSFGYSPIVLSLIFAIYPLSIILFSPFMGYLADNVGRKAVIRLGIALEMCAFALYIYGSSYLPLLILARIFNAISTSTVGIIVFAKINDLCANKTRGKYSGIYLSVEKVAHMSAPVLGGFIADKFFVELPFFTGIIVMGTLLVLLFTHAKNKHIEISASRIINLKAIKHFLSHRVLRGMAILGIVMIATNAAYMIFLPIFIVENMNLSYKYVGILMFVFQAAQFFQFFWGTLSDKVGRRKMIILGCTIKGLMWVMIPFAPGYAYLLLVMAIAGVGGSIWNVSAWGLMSDIGEKEKHQGEITTSYMSIAQIGGFLSFLIAGFIVEFSSIQTLFVFLGVAALIGTFVSAVIFYKTDMRSRV